MPVFKDNKIHAVRVYKYVKGETMNKVKINSEITTNFGFYVGHLTSILKVGLTFFTWCIREYLLKLNLLYNYYNGF